MHLNFSRFSFFFKNREKAVLQRLADGDGVGLAVLFEVRGRREAFGALFAEEGLFLGVDSFVAVQVRDLGKSVGIFLNLAIVYLGEGVVAVVLVALVGLFALVDSQMLLEARVLRETLETGPLLAARRRYSQVRGKTHHS